MNLALEWNYFDGVLPILQSRQDAKIRINRELIEVRLLSFCLKILTSLLFYYRKTSNVKKNYLKELSKKIVQDLLNIF